MQSHQGTLGWLGCCPPVNSRGRYGLWCLILWLNSWWIASSIFYLMFCFSLYVVHHLRYLRLLIAVWRILRFLLFFFLNATVIKEICVRLHCEVNVILGRKLKFQNITAATKCTVLHVPVIYNCLFFFFFKCPTLTSGGQTTKWLEWLYWVRSGTTPQVTRYTEVWKKLFLDDK